MSSARRRSQAGPADYAAQYAAIVAEVGACLLPETPAWRANPDWGRALGYDARVLDRANRESVDLVRRTTTAADAADHHAPQVQSLRAAGVDLVHAMTMTTPAEAIGVVRAARSAGVPVAVSLTVETDGRLPDGGTLADAISAREAADPADFYGAPGCESSPRRRSVLIVDAGPDEKMPHSADQSSSASRTRSIS